MSYGVSKVDRDYHKFGKNDLLMLPWDGEEAVPLDWQVPYTSSCYLRSAFLFWFDGNYATGHQTAGNYFGSLED